MSDLVPRDRRDVERRPPRPVRVRDVGGNLRQVTGTEAGITAYVRVLLAQGVRVKVHEARRAGTGGTVTRHLELIPPHKRGQAPWWLIGGSILLVLAVIGTVTIMGMRSLTQLVADHPGWSLVAAVLIALFAGGGVKIFVSFNRR